MAVCFRFKFDDEVSTEIKKQNLSVDVFRMCFLCFFSLFLLFSLSHTLYLSFLVVWSRFDVGHNSIITTQVKNDYHKSALISWRVLFEMFPSVHGWTVIRLSARNNLWRLHFIANYVAVILILFHSVQTQPWTFTKLKKNFNKCTPIICVKRWYGTCHRETFSIYVFLLTF